MDRLENLAARVEDFERALSRLEGDIERLTDRVEATNSRVSRIEEANMGAIEEPQAGRLRTVIDAMPAFYQAFQMMGMDVREIQNADDLTDEQRRELLKNVRETLDQQ
jgi:predicted  nucleic acid-binding Zn-ribbon protein